MSVIAVRKKGTKIEIASDSILVSGWTQAKDWTVKLNKINGMIIGGVGKAETIAMFSIFCETRKPKNATESDITNFLSEYYDWLHKKTDARVVDNSFILVYKHKIFAISDFFVYQIKSYHAIGAGSDFALAALYLGHDVKKAVKTACHLSIYCEEPIKLIKD